MEKFKKYVLYELDGDLALTILRVIDSYENGVVQADKDTAQSIPLEQPDKNPVEDEKPTTKPKGLPDLPPMPQG